MNVLVREINKERRLLKDDKVEGSRLLLELIQFLKHKGKNTMLSGPVVKRESNNGEEGLIFER